MRLCFFDGLDRIEICDRNEIGSDQLNRRAGRRGYVALAGQIDLHEAWQAERFVRRYFQGGEDIHRLRALLSSQFPLIHRLADEDVLGYISSSLQSGHLRAALYKHAPVAPIRMQGSAGTERTSASEVRPPVSATKKAPSSEYHPRTEAPGEGSRASPNTDELERKASTDAAQDVEASMLEEGAKGAVPFCAICELMKAKLRSGT